MAVKKDFHEPWKNFHEQLMGLSEAMKIGNFNIHGPEKINGSYMSILWDFYETTVCSAYEDTFQRWSKSTGSLLKTAVGNLTFSKHFERSQEHFQRLM